MCRPKGLSVAVTLGLSLLLDAAAADAQRMYWADRGTRRIQSARLDGTDVQNVIVNVVERPWGIALDAAGDKIYWYDLEKTTIQRARLDGSNVEDLVHAVYSSPSLPAPVLDPGGGRMYWAEQGGIRRARLDGSNVEVLITGQFGPTGLALDPGAGKIYWNDADQIQRANLDGSGVELLVRTGATLFNQSPVTLDLAGGKMYWAASLIYYEPARIQRANLDGSQVENLVVGVAGTQGPLVLDVAAGKMYWSQGAFPWSVRRANLDGSNIEDVVQTATPPVGLTLDTAAGKMYWTVNSLPTKIQRANLDGSSLEDVVTAGLTAPDRLGLNAGDGKLYWSDSNGRKIERADRNGAHREEIVSAVIRTPGPITVDRAESRIYWADVGKVYRASLDGSKVEAVVATGSAFAGAVALDPVEGKLYWSILSDVFPGGVIRRGNRDGSDPETVVSIGSGTVGMALDLAARKIYWVEIFGGPIRRANLDGSAVQDLITGPPFTAQGPIALDPVAGKMYWVAGGGNATIQRANLDGSNAEPLIPVVGARGLAVDLATHQIYWTSDASPPAIMRADLSGLHTLVPEGLVDPWAIALDVPLVPMAGTGLVRSASADGFDSFAHVFEALPGAMAVGPIGSKQGALKDVDVDPTTGLIYTIDFRPGAFGQQVYVVDPATGAGTPLPNPTGLAAPALIWGLAFDSSGTLYGGGLGVYTIDKATGRASALADLTRVPALILGMSGSRTGTGFLSTGLLLTPGPGLPYVGQHGADGAFVANRVWPLIDPQAQRRVLVDIGLSESGILYGNAWPCGDLVGTAETSVQASVESLQQALAAARSWTREALEAEAKRKIVRILEVQAVPEARSDLVLVHMAVLQSRLVAAMTRGAPLEALLLGLGRTIPSN
ncbi:MAG: hypothetical protein DMF83_01635 [Acidobacteria bacterium]|nr:MAG: hypothetical protein DMF83_01635 [Acidobacteriota bacterium]